ncbi:hypothetical protein ASF37_07800 [Aeromicrobium sp. Leaf289]|nr:hypothetical protein ASF37_07800 [Aeromicrobium sp. Leaf289]
MRMSRVRLLSEALIAPEVQVRYECAARVMRMSRMRMSRVRLLSEALIAPEVQVRYECAARVMRMSRFDSCRRLRRRTGRQVARVEVRPAAGQPS